MEKKQICESDSWFWLPPTERVKTFIVSVDTWVLVIYCLLLLFFKANQLLYFERWVWEKPFFSFGTSPRLNLPVTATVLCQSFSGALLGNEVSRDWPNKPTVLEIMYVPRPLHSSFYIPVCLLLKTQWENVLRFEGGSTVNMCHA